MLLPGEALLFSPREILTATALKMERHIRYGRQFCGGDHCPRNRRWSWRGLRTGGGSKCHCAEQQYSGCRQSHAGFPQPIIGSIILAPLLKRHAPFGTKRTSRRAQPMSAFGGKADITQTYADVCF